MPPHALWRRASGSRVGATTWNATATRPASVRTVPDAAKADAPKRAPTTTVRRTDPEAEQARQARDGGGRPRSGKRHREVRRERADRDRRRAPATAK